MLVVKDEPSSKDVEAVADFISFGADIAKIMFTDIVELINESAKALSMIHLCQTIEHCHSVAKIHILSSTLYLLSLPLCDYTQQLPNRIGAKEAKSIADALLMNQAVVQLNLSELYYHNITIFTYTCRRQ